MLPFTRRLSDTLRASARPCAIVCLGLLSLLGAQGALAADAADAPVVLLPNYDRVLMGELGAVEGGAMTARADNPSAGWYNPAGLALAKQGSFSANVNVYEATWVSLASDGDSQGSMRIRDFPPFVGSVSILAKDGDRTTLAWGFSVAKPLVWTQSLDFAEQTVDPETGQRSDYAGAYALELGALAPGAAIGWAPRRNLRVGMSARLYQLNLTLQESAFMRDVEKEDDYVDTLLYTSSLAGTTYALRGAASVQYEPTSWLQLGLLVRSPTVALSGQGSYSTQLVWGGNLFFEDRLWRDEEMAFELRLPAEASLGVAVKTARFELEADVRVHLGLPSYEIAAVYTEASGYSYDIEEEAFEDGDTPDSYFEATTAGPVINGALGGRVYLNEKLSVHAGAFTDFSPVADDDDLDELFTELDLFGATLGLSIKGKHSSTTLGLVATYGEAGGWAIDKGEGREEEAKLRVTSVGFVLAGSYWY